MPKESPGENGVSTASYYSQVCLPEGHGHSLAVADKCAEYELTFRAGTTTMTSVEPGESGPLTTRAKAHLLRTNDDLELPEAADQTTRLALRELLSRLYGFKHIPNQVNQE